MAGSWALSRVPVSRPTITQPSPSEPILAVNQAIQVAAQEPLKAEIPVKLIIPAINLEANIFPVGLTPAKIVDTPAREVGWYIKGARPGEIGSAVFNGHFQYNDGSPGVFNRIAFLAVGDDIFVADANNQSFQFKVVRNETVNTEAFPLQEVYGSTDKATLKLVTCAGGYDAARGNFTQRTIIYAALVNH